MIISAGRDGRRVIVGMSVALLVWFGGMAALPFLVEPPAVVAFGPAVNLIAAVDAADASVLSIGRGFVTAKANDAGLVRRLYAGGAWFVWPALQATCRPSGRKQSL